MSRRTAVPGSVPLAAPINHRALTLLGVADRAFKRDGWAWEPKFDGYRALAFVDGSSARIVTRNGNDISAAFPEVVETLRAIGADAMIDGELTIADVDGRPDWSAVRRRCAMRGPMSIAAAALSRPATLYAFDTLAIGRRDVRPATFAARRAALLQLLPARGDGAPST